MWLLMRLWRIRSNKGVNLLLSFARHFSRVDKNRVGIAKEEDEPTFRLLHIINQIVLWPGKATRTFSDALTAVRRWLWSDWVFPQSEGGTAIEKLPEPIREIILSALAPAA